MGDLAGKASAGTVYTIKPGMRRCGECGSITTDLVPPGVHGRRHAGEGRFINCIGSPLEAK